MKRLIAPLLISIAASACARTQIDYLPNTTQMPQRVTPPANIAVLYDGPGRPYDVLGILQCKRYQPGVTDPVLTDVLGNIKQKASEVGGEAVIIRSATAAQRVINVHAEVIDYRD